MPKTENRDTLDWLEHLPGTAMNEARTLVRDLYRQADALEQQAHCLREQAVSASAAARRIAAQFWPAADVAEALRRAGIEA